MKKYILHTLMLLFTGCLTAQTTIVLRPDGTQGKDAQVLSYSPSTNFGNSTVMASLAWSNTSTQWVEKALIQFDLTSIPSNATITSATLDLYADNPTTTFVGNPSTPMNGNNAAYVRRITAAWDESTVVWNNQPSVTNANEIVLPVSTVATQDYIGTDVTQLISDLLQYGNHGLMIEPVSTTPQNSMVFRSSDYADSTFRPQLSVTYTVPATNCLTLRPDSAGKDAQVLSYSPSTNFGNSTVMASLAWNNTSTQWVEKALIQFDLTSVPANATITTATLDLYADNPTTTFIGNPSTPMNGNNSAYIRRITSSWNESSVIWTNQPSVTNTNQIILPTSTVATQDYIGTDVTQLVKDLIQYGNNGFMIEPVSTTPQNSMVFRSSDYTDPTYRPTLHICFTVDTPLSASFAHDTFTFCYNTVDTLYPMVTGGTQPYSYQWSPPTGLSSTTEANPHVDVPNGDITYILTVTDANNDTIVDSIFVTSNTNLCPPIPPLTLGFASDTFTFCNNTIDTLYPMVTGGIPPYTYQWSPAIGLSSATEANPHVDVPTGDITYTLMVTDAYNDTIVDSIFVTSNTSLCPPPPPLTLGFANDTFTFCYNTIDTLYPIVTGGVPPYTYQWSPATGLSNATDANPHVDVPTGDITYTLMVTDAYNDTIVDSIFVTSNTSLCPPPPPLTLGFANDTFTFCYNTIDTLYPIVTGGVPPYTYQWSPATGLSNATDANPHVDVPTVDVTYTLMVTDAYNDTIVDSIFVTSNSSLCPPPTHCLTIRADSITGKDSEVLSYSPTTNFGNQSVFASLVWNNTSTQWTEKALLQFDLSSLPSTAVITSATLDLYADNPTTTFIGNPSTPMNGTNNASYIRRVTSAWDEHLVNWNNQPTATNQNQIILPASTLATQDYIGTNVTQLVQDLLTYGNNGWVIEPVSTTPQNSMVFRSSDYIDSAYRPTLHICFTNDTLPLTVRFASDTFAFCFNIDSLMPIVHGGVAPYSYDWSPTAGLSSSTSANPQVDVPIIEGTYTVTVTDATNTTASATVLVTPNQTYCAAADTIAGFVYFDNNNDGEMDSTDTPRPNTTMRIDNSHYIVTDANGYYEILLPQDAAHSVYVQGLPNYIWYNTPAQGFYIDSPGVSHLDYDFAIHVTPDTDDIVATMFNYYTPPRPGFTSEQRIRLKNNSSVTPFSGQLVAVYDDKQSFLSAIPTPSTIDLNTRTVTWVVNGIVPNAFNDYRLALTTTVGTPLGSVVTGRAIATPDLPFNDINSLNNTASLSELVVGSYDPNDKTVSPVGQSVVNGILPDQQLTYTIRFQNTGTYYAENVAVVDTIDTNLDLSTLEVVAASHNYTYTIENRVITFYFKEIMLPDSNTNEANSHGFIIYTISPINNVADMSVITNTANIFFDFNEAIVTNTTSSTVDYYLNINGIKTYNAGVADLFPNPFADRFTINFTNLKLLSNSVNVSICNTLGQELYNRDVNLGNNSKITITRSDIPGITPVLFVTVKTGDLIQTFKLLSE